MVDVDWERVKHLSESINPNTRRNEIFLAKMVLELKKELEETREGLKFYDGCRRTSNYKWVFDEIKEK